MQEHHIKTADCNLTTVTEAIGQQVGFPVTLLDSKCFRIIESDTTSMTEFWKSNRKILAASKSIYDKLRGSSTDFQEAVDDQTEDDNAHKSKRPRHSSAESSSKLDKILEGVDILTQQSSISTVLSAAFECVVCKSITSKPQFLSCCKRIVGCQGCVSRWFGAHGSCPHCSMSGASYCDVKGLDDLLGQARKVCGESAAGDPSTETESDSDFELPTINFRRD